MKIDAIFSPAELAALAKRDLRDATCVVFDVLRATSTFVTALHHGAKAIVPVSEIAEALALRQKQPDVLLGGERDGVRIRATQTGGIDFDLGNSPREYTPEKVRGKMIVSTTTNGTRALRACTGAQTVLAASFLNLTATAQFIRQLQPAQIVLVCAGTRENIATEDVLAAGALCELLANEPVAQNLKVGRAVPCPPPDEASVPVQQQSHGAHGVARPTLSASVETARNAWRKAKSNLLEVVSESENARRLLAIPELRDDVAFCLRPDVYNLIAALGRDGVIRILI
ncbi:MAG: 2-phosphosulfolactate phosphatase [Verrucomicrobiota bacterium]|jgi:2-phosphosulfolactate phosphatase